jgi:hypothetical protein
MSAEQISPRVDIDARTFQKQLGELANTVGLKVEREGPKLLGHAGFVAIDIYVMIRQALTIYDLFFFLNADERRKSDINWKVSYSAAVLPLIRCMVDCLYNITVLIENPGPNGYQFRGSGFKLALAALDNDERQYAGDPRWDAYIAERRSSIDRMMWIHGLTPDEVKNTKTWPTLSGYLRVKKGVPLNPHQEFLKKLTFGFWQEYSGIAHATFQGLMPTAMFYSVQDVPYEHRPHFEAVVVETMVSTNIFRTAGILLCILTEVQASFRFDGARINQRLHEVWNALILAPEIKELYDGRYAKLMEEKGISAD